MEMNLTEHDRFAVYLHGILEVLENRTKEQQTKNNENAHVFILVIIIFYAVLAVALLLSHSKATLKENKNDPYHIYIKKNWTAADPAKGPQEEDKHRVEFEHLL
ncbi:hypothetical protein EOD39_19456 [Acipenser ruthenus]|uniref:Potassium voltage-gated channel subfamily E member 3 n=1 Tax=Acipenser ruthenus TaxID=7906 RepID=A0A444UY13_ACIRT|nr:hypothetical protein EOD39_19456 [Acipenser ruthenus]